MNQAPLAQAVGTTTLASLYQPGTGVVAFNLELRIAETSGNDLTYQICHDIDGTTFAAANAIRWNFPILANTEHVVRLPSMDSSGALAIRASANTSITFTLYGATNQ